MARSKLNHDGLTPFTTKGIKKHYGRAISSDEGGTTGLRPRISALPGRLVVIRKRREKRMGKREQRRESREQGGGHGCDPIAGG
jgi:hypothetical protein